MKQKKLTPWDYAIITLGIIYLTLSVPMILFYTYLQPAYMSVKIACYSPNQTIEGMQQYASQYNWTIEGAYNPNNNTITILTPTTDKNNNYKITKHEQCHQHQAQQQRLNTCDKPQWLYIDELECYVKQTL